MKKIIYRNPNDAENFDIKRFVKSLSKYAWNEINWRKGR